MDCGAVERDDVSREYVSSPIKLPLVTMSQLIEKIEIGKLLAPSKGLCSGRFAEFCVSVSEGINALLLLLLRS